MKSRLMTTVGFTAIVLTMALTSKEAATDQSSECWNMKYGECIESVYAEEADEMDALDIKCQRAAAEVCEGTITEKQYKVVVEQLKGE